MKASPSPTVSHHAGARALFAKYPAIGAISLRARTAYRFDVWTGATLPFVRVLLSWLLWRTLFSGREQIAGFTLETMTVYYVLTAFLTRLDQSSGLVWEYAEDIRSGRFAKYLAKPVNPFGHFLSTSAARTLYAGGISLLPMLLLAAFTGSRSSLSGPPAAKGYALALALVGLVFLASLNWITAVLAWKFTDITGFHMVKGNLVEFLSGAFLPLALLPEPVLHVMRALPFYHLQYLPAALFLGMRTEEATSGLLILSAWTVGLVVLGEVAWRKLRRLDEGVGA